MKKRTKVSVVILMVCSFYSGSDWAHGHGGGGHGGGWHGGGWHGGGGFGHFGGYRGYYGGYGGLYYGLGYPYYGYGAGYGYPYLYYSPSAAYMQQTPQTYIQQAAPVAQQNPSGFWYYCNNPEGYYPSVKTCSNGWQQVPPTPPPPQ